MVLEKIKNKPNKQAKTLSNTIYSECLKMSINLFCKNSLTKEGEYCFAGCK